MISAVNARVRKTTHKYGTEVPTSVAHDKAIDKANGNTLWMTALALEMDTINVAFDFKKLGVFSPSEYTQASSHVI